MWKRQVNLLDSEFVGQECSVYGRRARTVKYVRDRLDWAQECRGGVSVTVFTDRQMFEPTVDRVTSDVKLGWLLEARCFRPWYYDDIASVANKFDAIMTYDQRLIAHDPLKFHFVPKGGVTAPREEWGLWEREKRKLFALIVSDKCETEGHRLRQEVAKIHGIDLYGAQGTAIGRDKGLAYKRSMFAIVVEACREPNLFTEHLLDAIAYGCVPLYWGCPNIGDFLDDSCLFTWETPHELEGLLFRISAQPGLYYERARKGLIRNQRLWLKEYEIPDDWIVFHVLPQLKEARGCSG